MTTLKQLKTKLMRNPEFKKEYTALQPEYDVVRQILNYRLQHNLTQAKLAQKVGISRSNITRLESGNYNPSLEFLQKIALGMGKKIKVEFY